MSLTFFKAKKIIFIYTTFIIIIVNLLLPSNLNALQEPKVFFSSQGGVEEEVCRKISEATSKIYLAMFSFTSRNIAKKIVDAFNRGVDVRIILDKRQSEEFFSKFSYLKKKNINLKLLKGKTSKKEGFMHHKFIIIDDKLLLTGSYNFTASAERYNYENT